jgi:hypothetical protein
MSRLAFTLTLALAGSMISGVGPEDGSSQNDEDGPEGWEEWIYLDDSDAKKSADDFKRWYRAEFGEERYKAEFGKDVE